jgi:predicted alpha-1,2-mannosidase
MKKSRLTDFKIAFGIALSALFAQSVIAQNKQPVDYVDNFIGVRSVKGNCVIGPQLPFASICPSPQTPNGLDDGYNPKEPIRGFAQLVQSGTGWGTNGQVFFSPQIGLAIDELGHDSPKSKESAKPYEYQVHLDRYNIGVNLSPSNHSVIYKLNFPKSDSANITLDLTHNLPMDIATYIHGNVYEGSVSIETASKTEISGYGIYEGGFGQGPYTVYFAAELSKKPQSYGTWINGKITPKSTTQALLKKNDRVGAYLQFNTKSNEEIYLKVSISYKSIEQAKVWLKAEIPGWDYATIQKAARNTWNTALKKIEIEGGSEKDKRLFYTALYHAHLMPRNRTNDSKVFGKDVPVWDDHFAVWDTWRTLYPLHVFLNPTMVSGTINSFIARLKTNGKVKDAFVNGNEMNMEQGGNNVDNIIADAYVKNIKGVNWEEAYTVLKFNADNERLGSFAWRKQDSTLNVYKQNGWIPAGKMSTSMSLEYSYNDFCLAQVAKGLGKIEDYKKYNERSKQWVSLWDNSAESDGFTGFLSAKNLDGTFAKVDVKKFAGSWNNYYYEGSGWVYSWFTPHQFDQLVLLNGGKEKFVKKLNYGYENRLLNYDNEPSFLTAQAFHYGGRSDLTSYWTREVMKEKFPEEGTFDNDDSGAMSSWYIFSAMGFFPNAGQDFYYLNGPMFTKVTIHLANGRKLILNAPKASSENIYVKTVKLNGKIHTGFYFTHDQIKDGATLDFDMQNKPNL